LGGLELFGFNGFILGPVIAGLFLAAWQLHAEEIAPATGKTGAG
jgi:predicted PurR-regulated permease PerM